MSEKVIIYFYSTLRVVVRGARSTPNRCASLGVIHIQSSDSSFTNFTGMPETRLFEGKYFGVQRFDRTPKGKIHTVSAAGLLNADYRVPSLDYLELLKLCHILTKNMEEVYALFRIMVFNVAIKNRDDHAKNFSFQLIAGEWKLSPAYNLLPSSGFNGFHTTTVNNSGEPTVDDMMIIAEKAGLNKQRASEIIQRMNEQIKEDFSN